MSTFHINAKKNDFSDVVIISGDPIRVKHIAKNYLHSVIEVNNVRSMLGFTGLYKNRKISVMSHGIGIPSCLIYVRELIEKYHVKKIIRLGTCGTVCSDIKIRDVVIGMGACTNSRINRLRFKNYDYSAIADYKMLFFVEKAAKKLKIPIRIGNFFTTDFFYEPNLELFDLIEKYGIIGIEMETSGLYSIAAEFKVQAISICTVSDHIRTKKNSTIEDRETSFNEMIQIAFESILLGEKTDI